MSSAAGSDCLSEDTIAAFVAGALRSHEIDAIDQHLANCGDCLWLVTAAAVGTPGETSSSAATLSPTRTTTERFERRQLLAQGGMGAVYFGVDHQTGTAVAIKRLKPGLALTQPALLGRFLREAEILRKLDHPNIVKMIASERDGDQHQIVMEYVDGGSLRHLLRAERRLSVARAVGIVLELTDALSRAHHVGVIHRDIKPENVLLTKNGTPKLGDFGLAMMVDHESSSSNAVLGTMAYLSPEALSGLAVDGRSDLWALGVMLFEMVTGRRPFEGQSAGALANAVLNQPPPDLEAMCPEASVEFVDLVYRLLEKDREQRVASARQVGAELETVSRGSGGRLPFAETLPGQRPSRVPRAAAVNLPARTTPFVGRDGELAELTQLLAHRDVRAVTIIGPGGMGKSRLALEVGRQLAADLAASRDGLGTGEAALRGVFFVDLAPLTSADLILGAVAEVVGFQFKPGGDPKRQLLDYFREKHLLLLLDNFEHVVAGAAFVNELLQTAAGVKVLITSRERLGLGAEVQFLLTGMSLPDEHTETHPQDFSAVALFLDSARRVKFGFRPSDDDYREIVHICRLVHGMPLGIMLAATWVDTLSLPEIAGEITKNMDFLRSEAGDLPSRQQSIRAVFDHSWGLLADEERAGLAAFSVFRGGFTRAAAEVVGHASLRMLASLVAKSLIRRVPETGRYEIHELLRQYAESKLRSVPGDYAAAMERFGTHYAGFLIERSTHVLGPRRRHAVQEIQVELDNVRKMLDWMLEHGRADLLCPALQTLGVFYHARRPRPEAALAFGAMAQTFKAPEHAASPLARKAAGVADIYRALFLDDQGHKREALELISQALGVLEQLEHDSDYALALVLYPWVAAGREDPKRLVDAVERGVALYRQLGEEWSLIRALSASSRVYVRCTGDMARAEAAMRECVELQKTLAGGAIVFPDSLGTLGWIRYSQGFRREGCDLLLESLRLSESADDAWATSLNLQFSARAHRELGDYVAAEEFARRCINHARELGNSETVAWCRLTLGSILKEHRRYAEAAAEYSEVATQSGVDSALMAKGLLGLGELALVQGDHALAEQHLTESLELCDRRRISGGARDALEALGYLACARGRVDVATDCFQRALEIARKRQRPAGLIGVVIGAAWVNALSGQPLRAAELASLAQHHRATGQPLRARRITPLLERLEAELESSELAAAIARGRDARLETVFEQSFP
jgi:predicted ATPase/tetratricopeptide (TPR) repeat protein/predicted Ser/Thr protein kinase